MGDAAPLEISVYTIHLFLNSLLDNFAGRERMRMHPRSFGLHRGLGRGLGKSKMTELTPRQEPTACYEVRFPPCPAEV